MLTLRQKTEKTERNETIEHLNVSHFIEFYYSMLPCSSFCIQCPCLMYWIWWNAALVVGRFKKIIYGFLCEFKKLNRTPRAINFCTILFFSQDWKFLICFVFRTIQIVLCQFERQFVYIVCFLLALFIWLLV